MTVATKSMTHFNSAAESAIGLIQAERGLAQMFFDGAVALAKEVDKKDLLTEYDKTLLDAERHVRDSLDEGVTLSEACSAWRTRKSATRSGIKLGLDPSKFNSYKSFETAAKIERDKLKGIVDGGASNKNSGGSAPSNNVDGGASNVTEPSKFSVVNNSLSSAVQKKLNEVAVHLSKLTEEGQLKVLQGCDGQIHSLAKVGGRYSNVKKARA